jgi:hypothetical protein
LSSPRGVLRGELPKSFFRYLVSNFKIETGKNARSERHPGDAAFAFAHQRTMTIRS